VLTHDTEAQEVEALVDVGDLRLRIRKAQAHRGEHRRHLRAERLGVLTGASNKDDEIVRVPDEPVRCCAVKPPLLARARVWPHPAQAATKCSSRTERAMLASSG